MSARKIHEVVKISSSAPTFIQLTLAKVDNVHKFSKSLLQISTCVDHKFTLNIAPT